MPVNMATRNFGYVRNISSNNVKACPLHYLCRYCKPNLMRVCCLFNMVIRMGLSKCNDSECVNNNNCNDALLGYILPKYIPTIRTIAKIEYTVKNPCNSFSNHFIPSIDISPIKKVKSQINLIKSLGLSTISLSLSNIISNNSRKIIKDNYKENLHELFNFDGKILLTTNIKDKFCEKLLNNTEKFKAELNILKPDAITTYDANFYIDQPLFITLYNVYRILTANKTLKDIDIEQIFLSPPLIYPFFEIMVEKAIKLRYKIIGVPLLEINRDRMFKYRMNLINSLNWFKKRHNFKSMLISTNPNIKMSADYFSSQSWLKIKNSRSLSNDEKCDQWKNRLRKCIIKSNNAYYQKLITRWL